MGNPRAEAGFIYALLKTYDVKDFMSLIAIKQVFNTIKTCGFSAFSISNLDCFSGIRSFFSTNDLGHMNLIQSNEIHQDFDLLAHPEYLEDEFHFRGTHHHEADHSALDAHVHTHLGDTHHNDHGHSLHKKDDHPHIHSHLSDAKNNKDSPSKNTDSSSKNHGGSPHLHPKTVHKFIETGHTHEQHGHQDMFEDF